MSERKIKVAITIDDNGGMMFNKRRQSRDRLLIKDLCEKTKTFIYISPYSALLFEDFKDKTIVVDNPLLNCPDGECAFVEGLHLKDHIDAIDELIVYSWNKVYPSDVKLDIDIKDSGFKMVSKYDFTGNSHEKITKGIYRKT